MSIARLQPSLGFSSSSSDMMPPTSFLTREDGNKIAYLHYNPPAPHNKGESKNQKPGILFCPGFQSNMHGSKSHTLLSYCISHNYEYTAFDYHGHGQSSPHKCDEYGTIGRWYEDALFILDHAALSNQQIVVGSSMGGWMMVLLAQERSCRVGGLVGIGSAPDFTVQLEKHIQSNVTLATQMKENGFADIPTEYDQEGTYRIYRDLLEEAKSHLLLHNANGEQIQRNIDIAKDVPVRLIHGLQDEDIPWQSSLDLSKQLTCQDVELMLIKNGNHRLSSTQHLDRMVDVLDDILRCVHTLESS